MMPVAMIVDSSRGQGDPMERDGNLSLDWATYYLGIKWSVFPIPEGQKKPTMRWGKYQTELASREDLSRWFQEKQQNVGLATGEKSGFVVVDIDEELGWEHLAKYGIAKDVLTPTVLTPKGRHLYFKHPGGVYLGNNARKIPGCDFRGDGGFVVAPPSTNGDGKEYKWKLRPDKVQLLPLPDAYRECILNINISSREVVESSNEGGKDRGGVGGKGKGETKSGRICLEKGARDDSLFHVAACLRRGGMSRDDAAKVVVNIGKTCKPPFPEKDALVKISSAYDRLLPSERNLTQEIEGFVLSTNGYFSSTEVHQCLQLSTRRERKTCSAVLARMVEEGFIERFSNKNGVFRKIERQSAEIDWKSADPSSIFHISWPFKLEQLVHIYRKNIIVVAGSSNAGKTAFLLNVIYENMLAHEGNIHYFTSEMSPEELKLRLGKFQLNDGFWNFKAYDRSSKFSDAIVPDGINIIDYLELTDNFFAVGGEIKEIFDRLGKGIAIIAIQKKAGSDLARGAEFTLEKARLYISIDQNRLKIVKAKNFAQEGVNPNGKVFDFSLVNGCKFVVKEKPSW